MSEYQYYEFQAIDRALSAADRDALRTLSSRARITATSFTNFYEWGDFRGDPMKLMERWFDLHLYVANWGTHRLMMRFPQRLMDRHRLNDFLRGVDCAELTISGDNLILDIVDDFEPGDDWDDGSGWLAALVPLRRDVLGGDLRLFYLLWLTAVEAEAVEPDEIEPLPGLAPLTGGLEALAQFGRIDPDLVAAAAERCDPAAAEPPRADRLARSVGQLSDDEKSAFLVRLAGGDPQVADEFRARMRASLASEPANAHVSRRTAGQLQARARALRSAREEAEAERAARERKRQAEEAQRARRIRLDAIARRGEDVWDEIEAEIECRNGPGYDRAADLLADLQTIADECDTAEDFAFRLQSIRERHARKGRLIERLDALR